MAFKCKYCGNSLHPQEGQTMITCGRCDEVTRIFTADEEKKQRLLEDAADLRIRCLFDRAKTKYENVIQEYPNEGEAYWGYVLCSYGVEFQLDSRTGKYLPTLHRISQRSVLQDPYYQKALEKANPLEAEDYKRIALELDRIRKRFLELSQKEENRYDIFISFKQTDDGTRHETVDCSKAENVYHKLKEMGYRVFFSKITLADRGGEDYEPIIYTALEASKVMLVIGSRKEYLEAPWVQNEWSRFLDMMQSNPNKKLLPVLIEEFDPEELPGALQNIQGYNIDTTIGMDRLLSRVTQLIPKKTAPESVSVGIKDVSANEKSLLKRAAIESEAGHWEKAREYYNKILDIYPESAHAWTGLWLASDFIRSKTLEEFRDDIVGMIENPDMETLNIHKDAECVDEDELSGVEAKVDEEDVLEDFFEDMKQYVVPNYYEIKDMLENLPEKMPQYLSARKFLKKVKAHIDAAFKNENYQRAVQFADQEYRENLQQLKNDLEEKWKSKFQKELAQEREKEKTLRSELIDNYETGMREVKSEMKKAQLSRTADYKIACSSMKSAQYAQSALNLLTKVGDYEDALQKKAAVEAVVAKQNEIGSGDTYIIEKIMYSDREAWNDYKKAREVILLKDTPTILNYIFLAVYAFFIFACVVAGEIPAAICIVAGYAICWYMWKKEWLIPGYIALVILHLLQAAFYDWAVTIILAIIYAASFFMRGGFAKLLMTNREKKINLERCENRIRLDEEQCRAELNKIWQEAFSIDYDGVMLKPALDAKSVSTAFRALKKLQ